MSIVSYMLFLHKFSYPLIPLLVKQFYQPIFLGLVAQCMIDGVYGDQLEMSESPIIRNGSYEIIDSTVLITKFPRVIRTNTHWIAQSQQNRR